MVPIVSSRYSASALPRDGQVVGLDGVEPRAVHRRHLVRLVQRLELAEAGASADVGAQPHAHGPLGQPGIEQPEQAAAQEQVRRRAMGQRGAGLVAQRKVLFRQVDAVPVDRPRADDARVGVDVQVATALGEQRHHPVDLGQVLAQVRLHVGIGIRFAQRAAGLELGVGAGRRKARRDAVVLAAPLVPALDQRHAVAVAGLGGVQQRGRRVAVHHHLAGDHPRVEAGRLLEEGVHRLRMHGAIDHGRGGAAAQQFAQEHAGHALRVRRVGKLLLGHEGVLVEPFEQLLAVRGHHLGLRIVDMGVDETRADDAVRIVRDGRAGRQTLAYRLCRAEVADAAGVDHDQRVGLVDQAGRGLLQERVAAERHRGGADGGDGHVGYSLSKAVRPWRRPAPGTSRASAAPAPAPPPAPPRWAPRHTGPAPACGPAGRGPRPVPRAHRAARS